MGRAAGRPRPGEAITEGGETMLRNERVAAGCGVAARACSAGGPLPAHA